MRTVEDVSIPDLDLEAMQEVLEDAPVAVAVLYGSYARGEASARSDVDVAVGFQEDLPEDDRTHARLDLMAALDVATDGTGADVIPLDRAPEALLREIWTDGVLLLGSADELEEYGRPEPPDDTHADRVARADEILADLERVV